MINDTFSSLLQSFMRRIRASAAGVATEIGMSREAVNNWRNGLSMPSPRHRDKVMACANYLRLTERESNDLLSAAGFSSEFLLTDDLPQRLCADYIEGLFDRFSSMGPYPILMLLSQAGWGEPPFREALMNRAISVFGEANTLHIVPPFSLGAGTSDYFCRIAQQCGLSNIEDDYGFEKALEDRLKQGDQLCLIVSRFEQGDSACREALAGIIRSLSDMYPGQLFIILCGGQRLVDLKYQNGDLSLLNIATVEYWPELDAAEIALLAAHRCDGLTIDPSQAESLLELSGGHPGLIHLGLMRLNEQGRLDLEDHRDLYINSDLLWQTFSQLMGVDPDRLTALLASESLGPARPYINDPLLASLFWHNLIRFDASSGQRQLVWRCRAIQQAGRCCLEAATGD